MPPQGPRNAVAHLDIGLAGIGRQKSWATAQAREILNVKVRQASCKCRDIDALDAERSGGIVPKVRLYCERDSTRIPAYKLIDQFCAEYVSFVDSQTLRG